MNSPQILLIDSSEKHRNVLRRFIMQSQPGANLIEIDPSATSLTDNEMEWEDVDLLIIDNQLGGQNGIHWVRSNIHSNCFPPVIFLSSMNNPSSQQARESMAQGLELGAISFMFKKQLDSKDFHQQVKSALKKREQERINNCGRVATLNTDEVNLIKNDEPTQPAMADTFHQMQHAKALLHGHDAWPFPVKDLLAGKAEFSGYQFKSYMGRRDGIYSFKGNRVGSQQPLALKLIDKAVTQAEPLPEKLEQDLETLKNFDHPSMVKWLDYQYVDGQLLIVQELIQGQRLSHRLERTGVTEEQAVKYTLQILSVLDVMHQHGLNAGEISPDNIIFRDDDTVVLTHLNNVYFDLSELESSMTAHMYKDALYLSPEIIQGRHVDHRSDFYITATILYHMLAGDPPFHGKTSQDVITEHVASPAPRLPNNKHPLNDILQNMMLKTPSQRFQTAEEITRQIKRLYP